jgi:hypothetical protein
MFIFKKRFRHKKVEPTEPEYPRALTPSKELLSPTGEAAKATTDDARGNRRVSIVATLDEFISEEDADAPAEEPGGEARKASKHLSALRPVIEILAYILISYLWYSQNEVDSEGNPW